LTAPLCQKTLAGVFAHWSPLSKNPRRGSRSLVRVVAGASRGPCSLVGPVKRPSRGYLFAGRGCCGGLVEVVVRVSEQSRGPRRGSRSLLDSVAGASWGYLLTGRGSERHPPGGFLAACFCARGPLWSIRSRLRAVAGTSRGCRVGWSGQSRAPRRGGRLLVGTVKRPPWAFFCSFFVPVCLVGGLAGWSQTVKKTSRVLRWLVTNCQKTSRVGRAAEFALGWALRLHAKRLQLCVSPVQEVAVYVSRKAR
jgi:hypothetical protein